MKILSVRKSKGKLVTTVLGREYQDDSQVELAKLFDLLSM